MESEHTVVGLILLITVVGSFQSLAISLLRKRVVELEEKLDAALAQSTNTKGES